MVAEGEREGWPYLVITKLAGVLGSDAWLVMPEAEKVRTVRTQLVTND